MIFLEDGNLQSQCSAGHRQTFQVHQRHVLEHPHLLRLLPVLRFLRNQTINRQLTEILRYSHRQKRNQNRFPKAIASLPRQGRREMFPIWMELRKLVNCMVNSFQNAGRRDLSRHYLACLVHQRLVQLRRNHSLCRAARHLRCRQTNVKFGAGAFGVVEVHRLNSSTFGK